MRVLLTFTLFLTFYGCATAQEKKVDNIADCQIIRVIEMPLTKKPNVKTEPKIALLNTCLDDEPVQQLPTIGVVRDGKTIYRTFLVVKVFKNKSEAQKYAKKKSITDVDFSEN